VLVFKTIRGFVLQFAHCWLEVTCACDRPSFCSVRKLPKCFTSSKLPAALSSCGLSVEAVKMMHISIKTVSLQSNSAVKHCTKINLLAVGATTLSVQIISFIVSLKTKTLSAAFHFHIPGLSAVCRRSLGTP
jgi:hypothetical protein